MRSGATLSARGSFGCGARTAAELIGQSLDDLVARPVRAVQDRVADRDARRVAVRDHGQPAQAEQVGAAVRLRVDLLANGRNALLKRPAPIFALRLECAA